MRVEQIAGVKCKVSEDTSLSNTKGLKIYEYNDKPMLCKKCLKYGQTENRCSSLSFLCGKCAETGHRFEGCDSEVVKCCSCGGNHVSGHSTCPDRKKEDNIENTERSKSRKSNGTTNTRNWS